MPNNNEEIDSTLGASELTPTTASSSLQPTTPLSAISNVHQSPLDHNNSDHHDDHHDNRSDYYGRELSDYSSSTMSNENSSTITNHPLNNNRNSINNSDHDHYNINDRNTTTTRRQTNRLDFTASTPAASSTSTQSHAPSFQTPTNTSTIFNNDFFQNQEVRRHAQAIALNIIRFVFRASPFVTRYLEELCYYIGMLFFVSLVLLHAAFYISPRFLGNPSQQSLMMSTLTKSEIVTNHVQQIKLMKIFSSQEAQNLTKHFSPLLRTALFGIDFHGFNSSAGGIYQYYDDGHNNFFKTGQAQLLSDVSLENSSATQKDIHINNTLANDHNVVVSETGKIEENFTLSTTSQPASVQQTHDSQDSIPHDPTKDNDHSAHTLLDNLETTNGEKTQPAVLPNEQQPESKEDINYIELVQKVFNLLGNTVLDLFIRPFSVKPRVTCLEHRIMEKYRDELIKRYENRTDALTAASVHSFLLRMYIEGPIDKMMKEWERELTLKKNKSQTFSSDSTLSARHPSDTTPQPPPNAQEDSTSSMHQETTQSEPYSTENIKQDSSQPALQSTTTNIDVDTSSTVETGENNSDDLTFSLDYTMDAIKSWLLFKYQHSPLFSDIFNDTRLFVYTTEKGLFYISRETKQTLSIPSYTITIDWNDSCFDILGGTFPYLLSFLIGYDTTILNTFVQYNYDFNHNYTINSGVLYSRQYDEIYYLKYGQTEVDAISRGLLKIAPLIVYLMVFVLVYYLVRSTQMNILNMIVDLQMNVFSVQRMARSFMVHLFQNLMFVPVLLGVIHFIDNFFSGDQKASLLIFCLIWLSQIFMNNVCNTRFSKAVFPWVLHFYCATYFIYYFRHPHGYSYLAFSALFSIIARKMLYLWNTYEYSYIINHHPILRDILGTGGGDANNDDFDIFDRINAMVHQRQGVTPPRIQNVQQFVFNLTDMNNGHAIEQQIGRFNISISLAQNNNNSNTVNHAPTTPTH